MKLARLEKRLREFGLRLRGVARLREEEIRSLQIDSKSLSVVLVGNTGSSYWPMFSQSAEFQDGEPDPLDRWSKHVAEHVAKEFGLTPVYPFAGPPYHPFQQWAQRAEALHQSPLGLMIHPEYGLWHSYRFGLLVADLNTEQQTSPVEAPCLSCKDQPCLNTCPVEAFSSNGYDVESCAAYLRQNADADCHQQGCQARNACPAGEAYRYESAQHTFHLRAFLAARWV